jgi:Fe-S oxidoreductase/nitrate reductase gamma subunit
LNVPPAAPTELTREIFWNIPAGSKVVFYILAAASVGVFGWGLYRRVRLWRLGRPTEHKTNTADALKYLIQNVLLQRRVLGRGLASLAHVLLFSGFAILFLGTILISIEHWLASLLGRAPNDPVFHKGVYYAIYEMVLDAFGLALLAGCILFARRRLKRPSSVGHDWRDWAVLVALFTIGVTGYVIEGLRILHEQTPKPGFSFVGFLMAKAFEAASLSRPAAATLHFLLWWFHAILALGLVAVFPYTRLLHALAGAVRLAAGPARLGALALVSAEEVETIGVIGVGQIEHFSRRQLLELDACVSCGRCEEACPAFEAGKPLSPKKVVQDIRAHLNARGPSLLAAAKAKGAGEDQEAASGLHGETISAETLWSCTTCSACVDVCPLGVSPLGFITDMRRHLIGEAALRGSAAASLQKTERSGNPWGLAAQDRLAWAFGLDVPTVKSRPDFQVLYWVGCAAAYDRRIQKVARSIARLLTAANVPFAILGSEERCTGESARRMGDEFLFQQLAGTNVATLERYGVKRGAKRIVSHCPHCVNSFKLDYPQMGGDYEVVHHTQLLAELAAAGRLPKFDQAGAVVGKLTYHDPCYLARVGGITEEPRQLLQLTLAGSSNGGGKIVEMPRHGRQTACCGAGGGRMWFDDAPATRIGNSRVKEALATGADTVAVSCPFCLIMTTDGIAAQGASARVYDVAELMARAVFGEQ